MEARLKKYATQEAHVSFPMRGSQDESAEWLGDEAYQTYSIRAGTAPWQEALRRQVLLLRFRQLHPDDELNQLIWQPRIQKRYLKTDTARVEQKRKEKLARKREHSLATSPTHSGDEMDIDREAKRSGHGGPLGGSRLEGLVRGPVSRMRNSSLSVDEHRRYLALERKLRRFQENADDSRPLTAEESAALDRLTRLVVAEQEKYEVALRKWVEGSRAPYKSLDQQLSQPVDALLAALKDKQAAALVPDADQRLWARSGRTAMPDFTQVKPAAGQAPVTPPFLALCRAASQPLALDIPSELPAEVPPGSGVSASPPPPPVLLPVEEWMREEVSSEDQSDVVVGLRTLLCLADPTVNWTVPFENVPKDASSSSSWAGLLTVVHPPLLSAVTSLRDLAELYYRRLVHQAFSAKDQGTSSSQEHQGTEHLNYESWKLSNRLRVMVGSERVKLQGGPDGGLDVPDAVLEVDVDYCADLGGELERAPQGSLRRLLYSWAASTCPVYRAVVDGKTNKLAKVEPMGLSVSVVERQTMAELLSFLHAILGAMALAGEGRFVAQYDRQAKECIIYKQGAGGAAEAAEGSSVLDLRAYIEASGQRDPKALSSFVPWRWPDSSDHVPNTFIPRLG